MNATSQRSGLPEPWTIHKDTLESLDPISKMVAEDYVKRGLWELIE